MRAAAHARPHEGMGARSKPRANVVGGLTVNGAPPTKTMIVEHLSEMIRTVEAHKSEVNRRWGHNRLPHIVPIELNQKFVSQRRKWSMACFECTEVAGPEKLAEAIKHGEAMIRAYAALEQAALAAGMSPAQPGTWEFELEDGTPIVLVRTLAEMGQVKREPPAQVWCLDEIGKIITRFPQIVMAKNLFPETEVIQMGISKEAKDAVTAGLDEIPF